MMRHRGWDGAMFQPYSLACVAKFNGYKKTTPCNACMRRWCKPFHLSTEVLQMPATSTNKVSIFAAGKNCPVPRAEQLSGGAVTFGSNFHRCHNQKLVKKRCQIGPTQILRVRSALAG